MKKILLAIFVVFTLVSFSGCNLFAKEGSAQTLTGVLSEQSYGDQYNGTHLVTDDDGNIFAVNSVVLNLSSSEYVGNKVKVQVEYDEKNDLYNIVGVSVLEVLNGYQGATETVNYMNEVLGFRLQHQSDWQVFNDPDGIRIVIPATDVIDSPVAVDPETFAVVRYTGNVDDFLTAFSLSADNFDVKDSIIGDDQLQSKTYTHKNRDLIYVVFSRESYVYVLSFPKSSTKFYDVLNSFRFIPINDAGAVTPETIDSTISSDSSAPTNSAASSADDVIPNIINATDTIINTASNVIPVEIPSNTISSSENYDFTKFSEFQSSVYNFKAKYPDLWYYDGTYRESDVLTQYRFSDKPVDETNSFASLKLLSDKNLPSGSAMKFPNGNGVKVSSGNQVKFYVQVDGKIYLVEGSADIANSLEMIAASIEKAE